MLVLLSFCLLYVFFLFLFTLFVALLFIVIVVVLDWDILLVLLLFLLKYKIILPQTCLGYTVRLTDGHINNCLLWFRAN